MVDENTIEGQEGLGSRGFYFYAKFSKPFKSFGSWNGNETFPGSNTQSGTNVGVFANYATSKGEQVEVKIGVSSESADQAKQNLEKDVPAWGFEAVKNSAKNKWTASLDLFKVEGGTDDQLSIFYTGIYFSNGGESLQNRMKLRDDKLVERAQRYAAMTKNELFPPVSSQGGMFQKTNLVMIADMYQRGIRNFDVEKAYANMKTEFMESTKLPWRKGPATQLIAFTLKMDSSPQYLRVNKNGCHKCIRLKNGKALPLPYRQPTRAGVLHK